MADDLVEWLRRYAKDQGGWHNVDETCEAAADRIEQLEAALKKIAAMTPDPEFGTPPLSSAIELARAALEGKDAER